MKTLYEHIPITGVKGRLGTKHRKRLKSRTQTQLIGVGSGENRNSDKIGYTYTSADKYKFASRKKIFSAYRTTVALHAAAMTRVGECERKLKESWEINVEDTKNFAKLCKTFNLSTDFVLTADTVRT